MFSPKLKKELADFIQELLQETRDDELPDGEISFILHVDGRDYDSWANIRNEADRHLKVPGNFIKNLNFDIKGE